MKKVVGASVLGLEKKADVVNDLIKNGVTWIHYDIMDGIFVKNKSLEENEMDFVLNNTDEHVKNLHCMVADPEKYIKLYKDRVDYITYHYEAESIDKIRKMFKKYGDDVNIGLAINPGTNVEQIFEFVDDASHILVMSVIPGKGGQKYIPETVEKIKKLRKYIDDRKLNTFIQVDGGVNNETGPISIEAGAEALVSGSFLINNYKENKNIVNDILGVE